MRVCVYMYICICVSLSLYIYIYVYYVYVDTCMCVDVLCTTAAHDAHEYLCGIQHYASISFMAQLMLSSSLPGNCDCVCYDMIITISY